MIGIPTWKEYKSAVSELDLANRSQMGMMTASLQMGAAGVAMSGVSTLMSSAMQYANRQQQVSAQSNNLIMTGTGFDMFNYGQPVTAITMWPDAYSRNQRLNDLNMNGCSVSEATDDITSLLSLIHI